MNETTSGIAQLNEWHQRRQEKVSAWIFFTLGFLAGTLVMTAASLLISGR